MSSENAIPDPWRVRRDDVHSRYEAIPGPWRVESPRGIVLYRANTQRTAYELAACMAGVEDLLARVNRLEQRPSLSLIGGGRWAPTPTCRPANWPKSTRSAPAPRPTSADGSQTSGSTPTNATTATPSAHR